MGRRREIAGGGQAMTHRDGHGVSPGSGTGFPGSESQLCHLLQDLELVINPS